MLTELVICPDLERLLPLKINAEYINMPDDHLVTICQYENWKAKLATQSL